MATDNTIAIRYSNDGANNWSDWRLIDAGQTGDFIHEIVARRLGFARHRVWEFRDTSARPSDVLAVSIMAEGE